MKSFAKKHLPGFISGVISGVIVSVLAIIISSPITNGFEDKFPKALSLIETASKHRSKLDIGQVEALEIMADLEKPLAGITLDEVYFKEGNYEDLKISDCTFMLSDISNTNLNGLLVVNSNFKFSDMTQGGSRPPSDRLVPRPHTRAVPAIDRVKILKLNSSC